MSQLTTEVPFFVSIPHSGENVPELTPWLNNLPETVLMSDVDRFVDYLYEPSLALLKVPYEKTQWHRYAVDLNRVPEDIDCDSVVGSFNGSGKHADGYHWVKTKNEIQLMPVPMSLENHNKLTQLIYEPFHKSIRNHYELFKKNNHKSVFHLDAHSMPSLGTRMHKDPGQLRADIVVSDCGAKSCSPKYRDLVIAAYVVAGFKVGYNWPYFGGRVTEVYGKPQQGQHAIQVELNRNLYMDEATKKIKPEAEAVKLKIQAALSYIKSELPKLEIRD
ncbi:MAG: N-formylglutamate amidohydrolase [Pseudobdellovibrio sp.]